MSAESLLVLLLRQTLLLAMVAALLLALRRPLLRRAGAALNYARWALLPLLLLFAALAPASKASAPMTVEWAQRLRPALEAPVQSVVNAAPSPAWLLLPWLLGSLAVALHMARQQGRFRRSLKRSEDGNHWIGTAGPALMGLWPARLVLPVDFAQRFDAQQQALVLAHEDHHRRCLDNHWNLLAAALCALHWFNPLAWLALRGMRADQELACDAAVMRRHPDGEASYGRALLLAQQGTGTGAVLLPWTHWNSSHPLIERIAMLKTRQPSRLRRGIGLSLLATLGLAAAGAVQAWQAADAEAATGPRYSLALDVSVARPGARTLSAQTRLVVEEGKQGLMILGGSPSQPTPEQVSLAITATPAGAGKVSLAMEVRDGEQKVLATPRVITADGVKARIEFASTGGPEFGASITPTRLDSDKGSAR